MGKLTKGKQDADGTICARKFCPDSGMMSSAGMETAATSTILLLLLRPLSALFFFGSLAFIIREAFAETTMLTPVSYVATGLIGIATAVLFLKSDKPLPQLRAIELTVLYATFLQVVVVGYTKIRLAAPAGPGHVEAELKGVMLGMVILMAAYAIFIPSSWKRTAIVLVPLALGVPGVLAAVAVFRPDVMAMILPALTFRATTDLLLTGAITTIMCVLGSALIGRYRTTALEARADGLYDLHRQIGEGGMGEVWLAEHKTLARPAAIKIVRPDLLAEGSTTAGAQAVKRFSREAQATAGLRSPHTVEIYDFGVTGEGVFYYVMEYLDGFDLGTLVKRHGPLPVSRAVHLLKQACESLEDAHQHALIHRDIKPANIFACRLGTAHDFVKVLDFGLVKDQRPTEMTQLTVDGLTTGTPAYMAPEMALQDGNVGPATDIYALGCVAYWLLTGKLVFEDTTPVAMIVNHVKTQPGPPSSRTELPIPPELDAIIMRCLEKDPAARYPSMEALAAALDGLDLPDSWDRRKAHDWWAVHRPDATLPELAQAS